MKKLIFLLLSIIVLIGCSAHTLYTVDFDLLALIDDPEIISGDVYIPGSVRLYLPISDGNLLNPDNGYLISPAPAFSDIYGFAVDFVLDFTNTGTSPLSIAADLRISNIEDANIYDHITDKSLVSDSVTLNPGETSSIHLATTLDRDDQRLSLIDYRGFRVGLMLSINGTTTAHFQADSFRIIIKQRPFDLIPPP